MQKYFEKIIERLEKQKENPSYITDGIANRRIYDNGIKNAIKIVNQVAEEFGRDINVGNRKLLDSLHEKILKSKFAEEVTEAEIEALVNAIGKDTNVPSNDGWIPVSEFMPADLGEDWVQVQIQEADTGFLWIPRTAEYRNDKWWLTDSDKPLEDVFEVTAWRKLPPYYQPEGE